MPNGFKVINVPAKRKEYIKDTAGKSVLDKDGNKTFNLILIGTGKCREYEENKAGFEALKKDLAIKGIVTICNRQIKTDCRNDIARPAPKVGTQLSKEAQSNPLAEKAMQDLLADIKAGKYNA